MPIKIWDLVKPTEITSRGEHDAIYEQVYAMWRCLAEWPEPYQEVYAR